MRLQNAWYIFLYHNVDWQLSPFLWNMKGSIAPDVFSEQLSYLNTLGDFVSIEEGFSALQNQTIQSPLISFWFDDFYTGVKDFAYPILNDFEISAAISVNSAFCGREHFFWRSQLCFLNYSGLIPILVKNLNKAGIPVRLTNVKSDTMQHFSLKMIEIIDDVFKNAINSFPTDVPFHIFDTIDSLKSMHEFGWTITNHTSHHYPITENAAFSLIEDQFDYCGAFITEHLGKDSPFLVLPFDRTAHESPHFDSWAHSQSEKVIVRVGDKPNFNFEAPYLYRINTPTDSLNGLKNHLKNITRV